MKILFFSPYFYPYTSGLTRYPFKILTHYAKTHSVTVLTFRHDKNLASEETKEKIKIVRMPYLFMISKGFISPQSLWFFFSFVKSADIVFLNTPNFEGFPLAIFSRFLRKPIISIFHCNIDLGKSVFSRIISSALTLSLFIQFSLSKIITAYSDYVEYTWVGKKFAKKIQYTLPPIETYEIDQVALKKFKNLKKNRIAIGYVGRISQEKGLEYLINAVDQMKEKQKYILFFSGPYGKAVIGEENYFNRIKSQLDRTKISYHFLGFIPDNDLSAFYKTIDVLVLPSTNSTEAFGMVQAESMIIGTPVISTDLPGIRTAIRLTTMGLLVKTRDSKSLSEAIQKILGDKNTYSNEALRTRAKEIFNVKKIFSFYDTLLQNV